MGVLDKTVMKFALMIFQTPFPLLLSALGGHKGREEGGKGERGRGRGEGGEGKGEGGGGDGERGRKKGKGEGEEEGSISGDSITIEILKTVS